MKKILAVVSLIALAGCVTYSKSVSVNEAGNPDFAYIYGSFKIDAPKDWLAIQGHQSMGFVFTCNDKKKYTIGFKVDNPLQMVKISPTQCTLTDIVYSDADGLEISTKPVPTDALSNRSFAAGKAYYLGDYFAKVESQYNYSYITTIWKIVDYKDNYIQTTQNMINAYPNMRGYNTQPTPIIPADSW
jgi:hypothetical protein